MAIRINLPEGEYLYVAFGESVERQICIVWDKGESPYIQGPMNQNSSIYYIENSGIRKKEEL